MTHRFGFLLVPAAAILVWACTTETTVTKPGSAPAPTTSDTAPPTDSSDVDAAPPPSADAGHDAGPPKTSALGGQPGQSCAAACKAAGTTCTPTCTNVGWTTQKPGPYAGWAMYSLTTKSDDGTTFTTNEDRDEPSCDTVFTAQWTPEFESTPHTIGENPVNFDPAIACCCVAK